MGNPLRVMVEVEREVLGLLKEFGEHSAGPMRAIYLAGSIPARSTKTADEPKLSALGEDQEGI
ncbi:MAG: hypothetical protein WAK42_16350 [Mycobacterium sp.]